MNTTTISIDLGNTVFHIIGMDERGSITLKKRLSRAQLITLLANTPACLIGMEASCGAHYLAREASAFGHELRLIPAQFVRPFVKSQKNDYVDAKAIAEAVQRPTMRFVPVKTADQLDLQAIHRVRDRLIEHRTSLINQLRAFLLERGLVTRTGRQRLLNELPALLGEAEQRLSPSLFRLLGMLVAEWRQIEADIEQLNGDIARIADADAACKRLLTVPGVSRSQLQRWWQRSGMAPRSKFSVAIPRGGPYIFRPGDNGALWKRVYAGRVAMEGVNMSNPKFKIVEASSIKMEDGAKELLDSPEMQPYSRYIEAALTGADTIPSMREIAALPLERRYVWRVVSALKWGFADFEDWNVAVDRQTLTPEDTAKLMQLLRFRPIQFCMFLKALVGAEEMERIMNQGIAIVKREG